MLFVAAISSAPNIASWSRACVSLAGVSDQVSFTVLENSLSMLAVNSSKTTHGEVHLEREFFKEISFSTANVLEDGYTESPSAYSFIVSSKHLLMLLKNSDAYSHNYVCLRVECSTSTLPVRRYKLNVEILTKKLVLKKYQIGFQPVQLEQTDIPARYEAQCLDNDVYHFLVQAAIIKLFLETAHSATEDFGIDTKAGKISFLAFTKLVLKERDYLKQPMLVVIQMAVGDLESSNLDDACLLLNFRLRDFRTFIGLISSLRFEARHDSFSDRQSLGFDTFFEAAGAPVLFQHKGMDITINFIQMTTGEGGLAPQVEPLRYMIHAPKVQKKHRLDDSPSSKAAPKNTRKKQRLEAAPVREPDEGFEAVEPNDLYVSYGPRGDTPHPATHPETTGDGDDTEYSTSPEEHELEYGPTQARDRPEPLFP